MLLNCAVARKLLQCLQSDDSLSSAPRPRISGLDWGVVPSMESEPGGRAEGGFSMEGMKQEEIVNLGIKELVLNAFVGSTSLP